MVGTPPADMSDVKATWLGMIENSRTAAKTNMTVTAFLGCRLLSTRPIQCESGSTPSRATAKRSREEATTAILVFYGARRCKYENERNARHARTHHDETDHGDDGHEDAWSFTQSERVELYEWLGRIEREERVQVRNAEQEEDGG
jgi:hypothetical protein